MRVLAILAAVCLLFGCTSEDSGRQGPGYDSAEQPSASGESNPDNSATSSQPSTTMDAPTTVKDVTSTTLATSTTLKSATTTSGEPTTTTFKEPQDMQARASSHNSRDDCWTVIDGEIYDLTEWIGRHPGGASAIIRLCGVDGTRALMKKHGDSKQKTLENYRIEDGGI